MSGVRIAPTTPIVSNGDVVAVNWTVAGNTSQIASWRVSLFGVLPHLPVPLQPGALATIANSPAGVITLNGGSARVTRRMPAISVARIPAAQRAIGRVLGAAHARAEEKWRMATALWRELEGAKAFWRDLHERPVRQVPVHRGYRRN